MILKIDTENKKVHIDSDTNLFELYEGVRSLVGGDVILYDIIPHEDVYDGYIDVEGLIDSRIDNEYIGSDKTTIS